MSQSPELPDFDLDRMEALARAADPHGAVHLITHYRNSADTKAEEAWRQAATPAAMLALIALARRAQPENEAPQADPVAYLRQSTIDRLGRNETTGTAWSKKMADDYVPVYLAAPAAQHAESGAQADGDELSDDDKRLVARGMERWRKGIAGECRLPPAGWHCTRADGHEGPCAAHPVAAQSQGAQAAALPVEPTDALLVACGWEEWRPGNYVDRGAATARYEAIRRAALAAKAEAPTARAECKAEPGAWSECQMRTIELYTTLQVPKFAAQQAAAPGALDADEMTRLRRLIHALGMDGSTNASDEQVRGLLFTALGQAAGKLERAPGTPEAPKKPARKRLSEEEVREVAFQHLHDDTESAGRNGFFTFSAEGLDGFAIDLMDRTSAAQLDGGQGERDA